MSSPPLASVCIPTRNRARWLGEALGSVFSQTLQDFEVVVCDDASSDDTGALVEGWRDPRLRYHRHPHPLGVAANRNACRSLARGRYVAWLDSDDRYLPHMLASQVAALESRPRAVMAHGAFQVIDADGRRLPDWPRPFDRDVVEPRSEALDQLVTHNYVTAPTVVVRRSALDAAGPYRPDLASGEDWEMWLRLCLEGDIAYTARPLAQYRWHPESLSRAAEASGAQLERDLLAVTGVLARNRRRIPRFGALRRRAGAALAARALLRATDCLTRGQRGRALGAGLLALRARPLLAGRGAAWRGLASLAAGDEFGWHAASRALLRDLAAELRGSRLEQRLDAGAAGRDWQDALERIAARIRSLVPADAAIAVVDKWDPTLLHLSGRRGWHFPDRRLLCDGYPRDGAAAVAHLFELRRRGARYLVVPSASFWWLDAYPELSFHLEEIGERVWEDGDLLLFLLSPYQRAVPGADPRG